VSRDSKKSGTEREKKPPYNCSSAELAFERPVRQPNPQQEGKPNGTGNEPNSGSLGRSPKSPIKGWYGLKKGLRGRFGVYIPPLMEALGLCRLEHNPKNNRMRAT